ncbi:hypothetical protein M569_08312, partial [Genlisea aurea]
LSDGVPKEGLRVDEVLVRIGTLTLFRDKVNAVAICLDFPMMSSCFFFVWCRQVKSLADGTPLFPDDIVSRFPGLNGGKVWKKQHDRLLLQAVMRHGYGRWQSILDDKDLRFQEAISQELNLPLVNPPGGGASQPQPPSSSSSEHVVEAHGDPAKAAAVRNAEGGGGVEGTYQDQSVMLTSFKEMQRRQVEFIKKRVLLLEKCLCAELQKVYYADEPRNDIPNGEPDSSAQPDSAAASQRADDRWPRMESISPEEISRYACDDRRDRLEMARLYNE